MSQGGWFLPIYVFIVSNKLFQHKKLASKTDVKEKCYFYKQGRVRTVEMERAEKHSKPNDANSTTADRKFQKKLKYNKSNLILFLVNLFTC